MERAILIIIVLLMTTLIAVSIASIIIISGKSGNRLGGVSSRCIVVRSCNCLSNISAYTILIDANDEIVNRIYWITYSINTTGNISRDTALMALSDIAVFSKISGRIASELNLSSGVEAYLELEQISKQYYKEIIQNKTEAMNKLIKSNQTLTTIENKLHKITKLLGKYLETRDPKYLKEVDVIYQEIKEQTLKLVK